MLSTAAPRKRSHSPAVNLPTPFAYQTCWYFKKNGRRVTICQLTPEQKEQLAKYKRTGKEKDRPQLTAEQGQIFLGVYQTETVTPATAASADIRVDTLAELYLSDRAGLVGKKFNFYKLTLQSFCKLYGANLITEITPSLVRKWRAKVGQGWESSSTVRDKYKVILQLFNWAVTEQLLPFSPLVRLGKDLSKEAPDKVRDFLITPELEANLYKTLNPSASLFFRVLMLTGRRPDEICCLKKTEVRKLGERLIWSIHKHKNFKKTLAPETIYLTTELEQITKEALANPDNQTEFLFVNQSGKQWTVYNYCKVFKLARRKLKQPKTLVPYCCRHTFITRALSNGIPIAVVAKLVGNSVAIIAKHYAHLEKLQADLYFNAVAQATS